MLELTLPSALDPSLAPRGRHVASMFVQYAPWAPRGSSWEAERERFADRACALVDEVAPGGLFGLPARLPFGHKETPCRLVS